MNIRSISQEQEKLILNNQKLVHYFVKKLYISESDYDDLASIGTIGLIKAAITFDKNKGVKFVTYASRCIKAEFSNYFKKELPYKNFISLDECISHNSEDPNTILGDIISDSSEDFTEKIVNNEDFIRFISIVLNCLKQKETLVILYQLSGINQDYIASLFNVTKSYIGKIKKQACSKIKDCFIYNRIFREVFSMSIINDSYKISFSSKDIPQFNKIFAKLLQSSNSTMNCSDFKISYNQNRCIIRLPAHPESFLFIAQIIQEIDDFDIKFIADKATLLENDTSSKKNKTNNRSNTCTNEKEELINYMLSMDCFTVSQLKKHFPNLAYTTISNSIHQVRAKGDITRIDRGKYVVNKNYNT